MSRQLRAARIAAKYGAIPMTIGAHEDWGVVKLASHLVLVQAFQVRVLTPQPNVRNTTGKLSGGLTGLNPPHFEKGSHPGGLIPKSRQQPHAQ